MATISKDVRSSLERGEIAFWKGSSSHITGHFPLQNSSRHDLFWHPSDFIGLALHERAYFFGVTIAAELTTTCLEAALTIISPSNLRRFHSNGFLKAITERMELAQGNFDSAADKIRGLMAMAEHCVSLLDVKTHLLHARLKKFHYLRETPTQLYRDLETQGYNVRETCGPWGEALLVSLQLDEHYLMLVEGWKAGTIDDPILIEDNEDTNERRRGSGILRSSLRGRGSKLQKSNMSSHRVSKRRVHFTESIPN